MDFLRIHTKTSVICIYLILFVITVQRQGEVANKQDVRKEFLVSVKLKKYVLKVIWVKGVLGIDLRRTVEKWHDNLFLKMKLLVCVYERI